MLVTQWFCRGCKRIIDTAEVRDDRRHVKNDCNGECFIITADDIVENPTSKKFRQYMDNIPLDTTIRMEIWGDIECLRRYGYDSQIKSIGEKIEGAYLKYNDVMDVLQNNREYANLESELDDLEGGVPDEILAAIATAEANKIDKEIIGDKDEQYDDNKGSN